MGCDVKQQWTNLVCSFVCVHSSCPVYTGWQRAYWNISRAGCNVLLSYLLNHKATKYQVKPWRATNAFFLSFFLSLSRNWERCTFQSTSQILSNHQQCGRCFLPTWTADHCIISCISNKTFYSKNMAPTVWPEIKSQRLKD